MTSFERYLTFLATLLTVGGSLGGIGLLILRAVWHMSADLARDRQATTANTEALKEHTEKIGELSDTVAYIKGLLTRRR